MTRPALALAGLLLATAAALAEPVRPSDDTLVLAAVPPGLSAGSAWRSAEAALAANPADLATAIAFARTAIEEGRTRADPRFHGRAEAALKPWFADPDPVAEVRLLRAAIAQASHRFADAAADLDAVLAARPDDAAARLARAGIRIVTGDLAGARADCDAVRSARQPLPGAVCRARIAALTGEAEPALAGLRRAVALSAPGPQRRFAGLIAAETAAMLGQPEEALALLDSVAEDGPDVPLLAARADLLLDLDRPADALAALDGAGKADVLLLARARAAKALGVPHLADFGDVLTERFAAARALGNRVHLREEARFRLSVAGDSAGALALARENWTVQKEPADARLLLEAALAAGDPSAARPVLDHLAATGLADARLAPLVARINGEDA